MGGMKLPQLNLRDLFWLVLVTALAVMWQLERRSTAAVPLPAPAPAAAPPGRFMIVALEGSGHRLVMYDTATGQSWTKSSDGYQWVNYTPPPKQ